MKSAVGIGEMGTGSATHACFGVPALNERKFILGAMLASLLLHVVVALLTWDLSLFPVDEAVAVGADEDEYIELFVLNEDAGQDQGPTTFVDVPQRQISEAPDDPQFLALHDSRAADLLNDGSDENRPAAEMESDFYQVAIRRDAGGEAGRPVEVIPPTIIHESEPLADRREGEETPQSEADQVEDPVEDQLSDDGELALAVGSEPSGGRPKPEDLEYVQPEPPSILKQGSEAENEGSPGDQGFDFDEAATAQLGGNVRIDNTYSLSTTAWDFAPWMHRFSQNLRRNIVVPPAWYLGVVDGHTVVDIIIEKDGTASYLEVAEKEGHDSLHSASIAAFHSFEPFQPLPPDFPDPNLVIRYTLIYPPVQKLRDEMQRARNTNRQGRRSPGR